MMLDNQGGKCKICGKHYTDTKPVQNQNEYTHLHVDHCHSTGKVRGLLCFNCNATLGHVKDNITVLKEAIKYLEETNQNKNEKQEEIISNPLDTFCHQLETNQSVERCKNNQTCFCTNFCQDQRLKAIAQNGNTAEHYGACNLTDYEDVERVYATD